MFINKYGRSANNFRWVWVEICIFAAYLMFINFIYAKPALFKNKSDASSLCCYSVRKSAG